MSFGKRITSPFPQARAEASLPPRRGGYPLAVLTVQAVGYLCAIGMGLVPFLNPGGRSVAELAAAAVVAILNVAVIAAVILFLVDVAFRTMKVSAVWAYAAAVGALTFGFCYGLAFVLSGAPSWLATVVTVMIALVPATVGGVVLGLFRRRA